MSDQYDYDESVDLDEIPDPSSVQDGEYFAVVTDLKRFEAQTTGKPCLRWKFKIAEGPYTNVDLDAVTILPLGTFKAEARAFKQWMLAAGVRGGYRMTIDEMIAQALDAKVVVVTKRKERLGTIEANVQRIKPWLENQTPEAILSETI